MTGLIVNASQGNFQQVKGFVEAGVDLNQCDGMGLTPLTSIIVLLTVYKALSCFPGLARGKTQRHHKKPSDTSSSPDTFVRYYKPYSRYFIRAVIC